MSSAETYSLKAASVLWVVWGLVHMLAGVLVLSADAANGFANIADAVDRAALAYDYHPAVGAILNQHAWNLLWGGTVTLICAVFIWRGSMTAIWLAALVGGLLDIGYFIFLDLGHHVNFVPGTLMTLFSASAIILSGWVWLKHRKSAPQT